MSPQSDSDRPRRPRRWLWILLRWGICAVAVTWVIHDIDWRELWQVLQQVNWPLVLLGFLAFGPTPVIMSVRLKWLLTVHDIQLTFWQAIKVTFACNFIIWTLPIGTSGGDSAKAYYIARDTPHKHEAVMTVFFDRVIGVVGLVSLSGLVVLCDWGNPAFATWGQTIGIMVLILAVGGVAYFSHRGRAWLRLDAIVARLPLAAHFQRLDRAVFSFRHRPRRVAACFLLTGVLQLNAIFAMFLIGRALGMSGEGTFADFLVFLGYTPICFLAGALPIGAMEVTFQELLAELGGLGTPEQAVSLSLLGGRIIQLIWSLPGALVVLKGRSDLAGKSIRSDPQIAQDS